jgi:periplasmic divalent cation tolerance protein
MTIAQALKAVKRNFGREDRLPAACVTIGITNLLCARKAVDVKALVVLVTVTGEEAAVDLGRRLVEEGLAACVQVLPGGTAIYRWQGELQVDPQVQLIIKTTVAAWERVRDRIVELHADEVPEILALPVVDGLPAYLSWLGESASSAH